MISVLLSFLRNHSSLVKFGIVGIVATMVHYAVANAVFSFFYFVFGDVGELFSNIMGYVSGFFISYLGNRYWSFSDQAADLSTQTGLSRFLLAWIIGFGVNQGVFYVSFEIFHTSFNVSITCGIVIVAIFTYLCNKYFVFR